MLLGNPKDYRTTVEKNHSGSSKSVETKITKACFNTPNHGVKYSNYNGDKDTSTESHIKYSIGHDIEKRTKMNYATRTLGSHLYGVEKSVKGLTGVVINYILKWFSYCISQKSMNPETIKSV